MSDTENTNLWSAAPEEAREVLDFWFGELDAQGRATEERSARWFKKDPAFDEELRRRFGALYEAISGEARQDWLEEPWSRLAYVIVLDQFSRNMFRDTSEMFARDPQALAAARGGVKAGQDRQLPRDPRTFIYMPLMHAEDVAAQDRCVELFAAMANEYEGEAQKALRRTLKYAVMHRDIVARFGRFPHRNAVLDRESTAEELAFLEQPNSSF